MRYPCKIVTEREGPTAGLIQMEPRELANRSIALSQRNSVRFKFMNIVKRYRHANGETTTLLI
jgi:hypothetical protein